MRLINSIKAYVFVIRHLRSLLKADRNVYLENKKDSDLRDLALGRWEYFKSAAGPALHVVGFDKDVDSILAQHTFFKLRKGDIFTPQQLIEQTALKIEICMSAINSGRQLRDIIESLEKEQSNVA